MPSDSNEIRNQFGSAVREYRAAAGYSQEKLALSAGLDRTYISGIERGVRNPTLESIVRLATALGCKPAQLLELVCVVEDE
jgi:transcriptional regulator with XRE-family HTH domain